MRWSWRWWQSTAVASTPPNQSLLPAASRPSASKSGTSSLRGTTRNNFFSPVMFKYTMERPRFSDHLEAIKFICKDFWSELFKKQIDNLKTNHRGTFVLQDNRFRWLTRVSLDPRTENTDSTENDSAALGDTAAQTTTMLLYFPCGLIRGALTNLGISCSVSADMSNLPACSFVVRIKT
ncbi:Transport protein particle (TRAPP) component [Zea mays]|uniref:Transport protein particle (TRAPP) component n=2 Tax=Zea mays TaxID=4577 RepID=A0A1D6EC74_MAIZE|nr:Transport protein particle (TRAPP) component [Zea mays]